MSSTLAGRRLTLADIKAKTPPEPPKPAVVSSPIVAVVPEPAKPGSKPVNASRAAWLARRDQRRAALANGVLKTPAVLAMLTLFQTRWPLAFGHDPKPLAIGIHRAIVAELGEDQTETVGYALQRWVRAPRYFAALAAGGPRFGLDGTEAGAVLPAQAANAAKMLAQIQRKRK